MDRKDILLDPDGDDSPFSGYLRQRRSRRPLIIAVMAILLLGAAGLVWYLRSGDDATPSAPQTIAGDPGDPGPGMFPVDDTLDLPAVDTSDSFVRRLIAGLSAHPQFAQWLVTDELARRFVTAVAALAQGGSPAPQLDFMAPADPFRVRETAGDLVIDPTSYLRYDGMVDTFVSLDTDGTARVIRQLSPLFERAHQELGLPGRTFRGDLERAIQNLLSVQVPERPPVVVAGENAWEYADPALENAPAAAKHLMRMGPANAVRVQTRLAELADALGIGAPAPADSIASR